MTLNRLYVWHTDSLVGKLEQTSEDLWTFLYAPTWLESAHAFALSTSLPLGSEPLRSLAVRFFFANLLPDGAFREEVARDYGISPDNDFDLLGAIGGECAGALVVTATERSPDDASQADYRPIDDAELHAWATDRHAGPFRKQAAELRLSLAGAQRKLPVRMCDDALLLPLGAAPSTHILKFPNPHFNHLPDTECLTAMLATHCGLRVAPTALRSAGKERLLLVERYDRVLSSSTTIRRTHQQDFCQALGVSPRRKYQSEGGPSFADCYRLASETVTDPIPTVESLLQWLVFNTLVGNADAHAKNLAFVLTDSREWTLAPYYDLVCTASYDRHSRNLAMSIGREYRCDRIRRRDWGELAQALGVTRRFILEMVRDTAARMPTCVDTAASEFQAIYGFSPALERCKRAIHKQTRGVLARAVDG